MALIFSFLPAYQILPRTWQVPLLCFQACTSATATAPLSQPCPLLNMQKSLASQKTSGQTIRDHLSTAISQAMLIYVHQTKEVARWPKQSFSGLISALQCPGDHHDRETNITLRAVTWPARATRIQQALKRTHSPVKKVQWIKQLHHQPPYHM